MLVLSALAFCHSFFFGRDTIYQRDVRNMYRLLCCSCGILGSPMKATYNNDIFVSVVNAILVHDYGGNSIRKVKTDKKDALKLASFALDKWLNLPKYTPEEDIRKTLKLLNRQYIQYNKMQTMQKNNLISLLDMVFPKANTLFSSPQRKTDGHEKWVDFILKFYHVDCVAKLSLSAFKTKYQSWCKKNN